MRPKHAFVFLLLLLPAAAPGQAPGGAGATLNELALEWTRG